MRKGENRGRGDHRHSLGRMAGGKFSAWTRNLPGWKGVDSQRVSEKGSNTVEPGVRKRLKKRKRGEQGRGKGG